VDSVDNGNERVGGLEWISGVVGFGRWQVVLWVDVCRDGSSIGVTCRATERETI
jgi:tRNA(Ser,Leu) C12 N-acetylase TAN1